MTYAYIDSQLTTGSNDGTSFDNAYQAVKAGMEAALAAGDIVWIRRRSSHGIASTIQPPNVGAPASFLTIQGCPRNAKTGTITFTNGSNVLSGCSFTAVFEEHCARQIVCDDGELYTISAVVLKIAYDNETGTFTEGLMVTDGTSGATGKIHRIEDNGATGNLWIVVQSGTFGDGNQITDADTGVADVNGTPAVDGFTIMEKYAGSTAAAAAFTISKDEDYDLFQAVDDSTWTIKKTDWNGDSDVLMPLDFAASSSYLYIYSQYLKFKNLHLKNSTSAYGMLWIRITKHIKFINCIFEQNTNNECLNMYTSGNVWLEQCILKGNGTGTAQQGTISIGNIHIFNTAIYSMGNHGLALQFINVFKNVNVGIELPNGDDDLVIYYGTIQGRDVRLGGANGTVFGTNIPSDTVYIENYNGVLGEHRTHGWFGYFDKLAVTDGSGDPYKRSGGADYVIALHSTTHLLYQGADCMAAEMFTYEIEAAAGSKTYQIYVQNSGCGDLNASDALETADIFLEAEYISGYGDATDEYVYGIARSVSSVNPIPNRGDASDWDDYIEVTVNPAVASKIRITMKTSYYSSAGILYIDPLVVIS